MSRETLEGRMAPVRSLEARRFTRGLFLALMGAVMLLASLHAAWLAGWAVGEALFDQRY